MRVALGLLLGAVTLSPSSADANGRFPAAGYFVAGPGPRSDVFALRTTFGVLVSRDAGRAWSWVCESAYGAVGSGDATISVGADGTLVLASFTGLTTGAGDYCAWPPSTGAPVRDFADISHTADGRSMVALAGPGGENALYLSSDAGHTWAPGARLVGYATETVDVAPGDPMRVYVTGYASTGEPVLLRSDDGGRTARETTRDFLGGQNIFLAGVDPTRPDVLYLRAVRGLATTLLRSDDGGMTLRMVGQTASEMLGFALSDDGTTVWIASANRAEGIQRSEGGGPWVRMAADVGVKCLRFHAGTLFVCADEARDGFALGYSHDGGDRVDPLLSLRALDGTTSACSPSTPVGGTCPPRWATETALLRSIDASAPSPPVFHDASTDHGVITDRGGPRDVSVSPVDGMAGSLDAGRPIDVIRANDIQRVNAEGGIADAAVAPMPPAGGCSCHVATRGGQDRDWGSPALWSAGLALVGRLKRRSRLRSRPLTGSPKGSPPR
ncbi:MAG: hypothetical protein EPO40_01825 [Myxococcaceae bacterium]|nr:MAG: hypothetical protein EPO40_01825 [Myxococcaceae bacterium]